MGRSSVSVKDANNTTQNVRSWLNADSTHSQVFSETYSGFRVTKVTVGASTVTLSSLLPSATALADRKKFVLYPDPNNSGYIAYSHATFAAVTDTSPLPAGIPKELWLDASADVYVRGSAAGQVVYVEEYA